MESIRDKQKLSDFCKNRNAYGLNASKPYMEFSESFIKKVEALESEIDRLKEVITKCGIWFEDVSIKVDKISTGNISHDKNTLKGFAKRCAEYTDKHLCQNKH